MSAVAAVEQFVTQVSTGLGALLGLNYYALVWAGFGAGWTLTKTRKFFGFMAIGYVLFSIFLGALIGTFIADFAGISSRSAIALLAFIGGASWQTIIAAAIRSTEENVGTVLKSFFSIFSAKRPPP
jgi:hypothetical protein